MNDPDKDQPPPSYDGYGDYPPQAAPYPPKAAFSLPQQGPHQPQGTYPPQAAPYPPQQLQGAYPLQQGACPLQQGAYPLQQVVYPPQCPTPGPAYPTEGVYPPNQKVYGDVDVGYCTNDTEILIPVETGGLSDTKIRHGFIRKVYLIQFFQFGIAVATIFLMQHFIGNLREEKMHSDIYSDLSKNADMSNKVDIASYSCFAIAVGLGIVLLFHKIRRKHPINIILLIIFTLAMSGFVGCLTVSFETNFIRFITIAVICTCIIILSLTLFACQTTIDFTMSQGPYNLAFFMIFLYSGFLLLFKYHWHFQLELFDVFVSGFLVSILSVVLVYETQRLTGEQFEGQLSPEEYVFGVLTINIGVITLLSRGIFLCLRVFRIHRVIRSACGN